MSVGTVLVAAVLAVSVTAAQAAGDTDQESGFADECILADESFTPSVGVVDCLRLPSEHMGAPVPVGYYVPPACDPAHGRNCPVLYYLHGTGGSYQEGVGAKGSAGSSWVRALTHGPPVDPRGTDEPWHYANTGTWVEQDPLDLIIVAPHGRTLPGGHGPAEGADTAWADWNPRYARGGEHERYPTPPPRPLSHLLHELIPHVDATFPTAGTRDQRAIVGTSLGGIGALYAALRHPDVWSSTGARSGGTLYGQVLTGQDETIGEHIGVSPPVDAPHLAPPGPTAVAAPPAAWQQMYGALSTVGFGDLAVDHHWWAGSQPAGHAGNARAHAADGEQSLHIQYFVNDAIPRRIEDFTQEHPIQIGFEVILYPTNRYLELLFDQYDVERTFRVGPGTHSGSYSTAYHREQLEGQYARVRHWDGGGSPPPEPARFDYRTMGDEFSVWDWEFSVDRGPREFLSLRDVSCSAFTVQGTGEVEVTVPARCRTGVDGDRTVTVDLGPDHATDEHAHLSSSRTYGRTVTVELDPLRPCPSESAVGAPPHCPEE